MASFLVNRNLQKLLKKTINLSPLNSRNKTNFEDGHRVVTSADGKVIVCWHPETEYLYENTRPIIINKTEDLSPLKTPKKSLFHNMKKEFEREKLMALTYTTKHRWFPEGIHKLRRKRNWEKKRDYL